MLQKFRNYALTKINNEKGQGMVEYALIIGLVAIVVIAVLVLLGPAISATFQKIIDKLSPSTGGTTGYIDYAKTFLA
ncbi:Flp family type IVb pilin [Clostridium rhizosphaerae]|uniref:Flp family type IVb pilin n=1 Tax=Clostridium rhizosphaerae TaxID=2803861 RepID=UPI003083F586